MRHDATAEADGRRSARLRRSCHHERTRPARQGHRPPRLHRLPRRRRRRRRQGPRPTSAPRYPQVWPTVGQPGPRPTRCSTTSRPSSSGSSTPATCASPTSAAARPAATRSEVLPEPQEHDDPRLHALGRGALQQRRRPVQAGPLRRELQHERRAAAAPDRAAADRVGDAQEGRRRRTSTRCRASRSASRATSCASSSAAAGSAPRSASPTRSRSPAGRARRLSVRGLGTENRTDPVFVGLQKTRLLDPTLNFLGTNDHPGDYRSSGCTACHVVYANDRSPVHSGPVRRRSATAGCSCNPDPTIPKDEPGHPIEHRSPPASRPASASSATSTPAPTS